MSLLIAKNITKSFADKKAVDDLSLEIAPAEIVALVGESGCGKTTMARILAGLERPDVGELILGDQSINLKEARSKLQKKQIQLIFQNSLGSFNPRKTIEDSLNQPLIEFNLAQTGKNLSEITDELMLSVGLEPALKKRFPHQVSGGQIQRAAIARSIACSPSLLIADEPTSALDVSIRAQILKLFKQLQTERKLSLLIITHDLRSLKNLAERVYVMNEGKIVESGSSHEILETPKEEYTKRLISALPTLNPADRTFEKFATAKTI